MTETRLRPEGGNRTRLTGPARIEGCPFSGAPSFFCSRNRKQRRRESEPAAERWACFRAVRGCSPPPGGGCGLLRPKRRNSTFKIQNYEFGLQPAEGAHEADLRDASCGPPPPGGCGPLRPCGRKFNRTRRKAHSADPSRRKRTGAAIRDQFLKTTTPRPPRRCCRR